MAMAIQHSRSSLSHPGDIIVSASEMTNYLSSAHNNGVIAEFLRAGLSSFSRIKAKWN